MSDPKIVRSSVVIKYQSDDGYSYEATFNKGVTPEIPMLEATEELARLTALFGFEKEAQDRCEKARKLISDWRSRLNPYSGL